MAAPENVTIGLLAKNDRKSLIKPAAARWSQQLKTRPLEVRLAPDKTMHDRLIIVDGIMVWDLPQSFNALATRAHTTIVRSPSHLEPEKIAVYEDMWGSAKPLSHDG